MGYMGAGPNWIPKLLDGLGLDLKIDYIRSMVPQVLNFDLGIPGTRPPFDAAGSGLGWEPTVDRTARGPGPVVESSTGVRAVLNSGGTREVDVLTCMVYNGKNPMTILTLGNPCKILLHGNCAEMLKLE